MVSTVLGKRSRASTDGSGSASMTTRSKKRALDVASNDENQNPFVTPSSREAGRDCDPVEMEVDNFDIDTISTPSKTKKQRTALSPTKIHNHFKVVKHISKDENVKITQVATPQTPRHRDALSKKIPITPRHRIGVVGKPLTPRTPRTPSTPSRSVPTVYNTARQLFARSSDPGRLIGRDNERQELSAFIDQCVESRSGGCVYVSGPPGTGKSALVNEKCTIAGAEDSVVATYINCMSMKSSKEICGKLVEELCGAENTFEVADAAKILERMFVAKNDFAPTYLVTLDEMDHLLSADLELLYALFEWSMHRDSRLILVGIANALDLTDRFLPRLKARNLKPHLLPFLPYTAPQIASVITTKLKSVLTEAETIAADYTPFIHPAAIQLCARKVASQTGDIRKAFDICRRAIDLVEDETKQKSNCWANAEMESPTKSPLAENINLSSPPSSNTYTNHSPPKKGLFATPQKPLSSHLASLTPHTAPRVTIAHIARLSSTIFGNNAPQRLQSLNLQQKAALCALIALEKRNRSSPATSSITSTPSKSGRASAPTVRVLYETYSTLCRSTREGSTGVLMLHPLTSTEFRDVVGNLETLSLITILDGGASNTGKNGGLFGGARGSTMGTPSKRRAASLITGGAQADTLRVGSSIGEQEVAAGLKGIVGEAILRGILEGRLEADE
ncbi:MAG: hypothetical protein M4579_000880 [Chaenotheca gracillima]|nr:MAG: hypothetical protein M4579_000880 [Chaenotheca gracillima]